MWTRDKGWLVAAMFTSNRREQGPQRKSVHSQDVKPQGEVTPELFFYLGGRRAENTVRLGHQSQWYTANLPGRVGSPVLSTLQRAVWAPVWARVGGHLRMN